VIIEKSKAVGSDSEKQRRKSLQKVHHHQILSISTHCNTLQHTATHCNTLQHTATHCNTLQHTATMISPAGSAPSSTVEHCNTLQHTATHCNTLQLTATHCISLQQTATSISLTGSAPSSNVEHCNTLQHTTTHTKHCSTLQHTATHCNTLQRRSHLQKVYHHQIAAGAVGEHLARERINARKGTAKTQLVLKLTLRDLATPISVGLGEKDLATRVIARGVVGILTSHQRHSHRSPKVLKPPHLQTHHHICKHITTFANT